MQNKNQKRNEARKNAEAQKAQRKANRMGKSSPEMSVGKKGKSLVPQSKARKK